MSSTAFERLVDGVFPGLVAYLSHQFFTLKDEAEDLAQEAIMAWIHHDPPLDLKDEGFARAWLFRVARNRGIDLMRHRSMAREVHERIKVEQGEAMHENDGLKSLEQQEQKAALAQALTSLEADQREMITLRVHQGLTLREISEITEVPISSVNYKIRTGLLLLQTKLEEVGV
jgi:RNA polymerase sigma-70 factor, ECF subfamily